MVIRQVETKRTQRGNKAEICFLFVSAAIVKWQRSVNKAATRCRFVASPLPLESHSKFSFEVLRLGLVWVQSQNFHHSPFGYPEQSTHWNTSLRMPEKRLRPGWR